MKFKRRSTKLYMCCCRWQQHRLAIYMALIIIMVVQTRIHTELGILYVSAEQQPPTDTDNTSPKDLNYYELLNLEQPDTHRRKSTLNNRRKRTSYRSKISTSDIKKAYRKQAQLYHPDKANRHNMTKEDATSRFAMIAQAYEVLSNQNARNEYDWDLLDAEDAAEERRLFNEHQKQGLNRNQQHEQYTSEDSTLYDKMRTTASTFNTWKESIDPWTVFEDFFFQDSAANSEDYYQSQYAYSNNYQSYDHQSRQQQQHRHSTRYDDNIPSVSEQTIYQGFDPSYGADIYTVLRREEYTNNNDMNINGKYFFRIFAQDFISGTQVDPYTGFVIQEYYTAISEPYLVEEGYESYTTNHGSDTYNPPSHFEYKRKQQEEDQEKASHQQEIPQRVKPSKLEAGESLTPVSSLSDPWISLNGKYKAILTSTCELQIISQSSLDKDDGDETKSIIWSSETYIPTIRADGCYLTLSSSGRLVLSVDYGSHLNSNTILWNTPEPPIVPHWDSSQTTKQQPITFQYYASLDDDGVIAVYREREERPTKNTSKQTPSQTRSKLQMRPIIDKLGRVYQDIAKASEQQGKTRAVVAWNHLRYTAMRRLSSGKSITSSDTDHHHFHECIFSTSPVGCLTSGRSVIQLSKKMLTSVKSSVKSIDKTLDSFISVLTDQVDYDDTDDEYSYFSGSGYSTPDDEDEDILDTLIRITESAGVKLGKAGIQGMQQAQIHGKKVVGKVVGATIKMKEQMRSKDEVDSFF